jgi:titin
MTREIYLLPEPSEDGTSEYVTNALLTINSKGRIISRKTTDNPTRPDPPTGLSVSPGSNEVSISWSAPLSDGGRPISNYVIQFSADNGNEWTTLPLSPVLIERQSPTQTSATIVGLSILTPYIFRVATQNSVGISDYTAPSDTVFVSADLPENPKNFTARRFFSQDLGGPSEINLSWEAGHNGGSAILGYYLEESEDGGVNWINYNSPENLITNTFETITGTDEDVSYLYRLSAFNALGQSSYTFLAVMARGVEQTDPEDPDDDPLGNWDFGTVLFTGGIC